MQALMINCEWVLFLLEREMQTKAEHGSDLNHQNLNWEKLQKNNTKEQKACD